MAMSQDAPTAGRQLTDALCVGAIAVLLTLAASAIARVSAQAPGAHPAAGAAPDCAQGQLAAGQPAPASTSAGLPGALAGCTDSSAAKPGEHPAAGAAVGGMAPSPTPSGSSAPPHAPDAPKPPVAPPTPPR